MDLTKFTATLNAYIWSVPLVVLALIVGLIFTISMKVPQLRLFKDMVFYLVKGKTSDEGISSFQGFAMALGGRIGVGNIAGVATAICFGGPGSIFWMWIIAFLGAGSAFAEASLAQLYKEKIDGEYRGGPAYYIAKGTGLKFFGILFAIAAVIANGLTGPTIQAFNVAEATENAFGINPAITGAGVAILFALVVFGGVKRIGRVAEIVVPIMAGLYILLALVILGINFTKIPSMFSLIFSCAFNMNAFYGAIWGSAVMWGVKRGIYSSEAGMGSGAHAAAAAEVSHPAKQGLAQALSIYVDTLLVCTATAIMILSTGMYNVVNEKTGQFLVETLKGVEAGTGYTQATIDTIMPGLGSGFIAVAVFFFAFTTLLSFAFYTETNLDYLTKGFKGHKIIVFVMKIVLVAIILFGSVRSSGVAWNLADIGVGLMAWINLVGLFVLQKQVRTMLKDYEHQKHLGLDPVFDPQACGLNAPLWSAIAREKYSGLNKKKGIS